jgi:hypothetical protein
VGALVPPLVACVPMVVAEIATRHAFALFGVDAAKPALRLIAEIAVGAAVYIVAALVVARDQSQDLMARVVDAVRSRA